MRKISLFAFGVGVTMMISIPAFASSPSTFTPPNFSPPNDINSFTQGVQPITVPTSGSTAIPITDPLKLPKGLTLYPKSIPLAHVIAFQYNAKPAPIQYQWPTIYFAWWCPHCHVALQQIQHEGLIGQFDYVSVWPNEFGKYPIQTIGQVKKKTLQSLRQIGVKIPASHLFFTTPSNPVNTQIPETPTFVAKVPQGYVVGKGVPASAPVWQQYLKAVKV